MGPARSKKSTTGRDFSDPRIARLPNPTANNPHRQGGQNRDHVFELRATTHTITCPEPEPWYGISCYGNFPRCVLPLKTMLAQGPLHGVRCLQENPRRPATQGLHRRAKALAAWGPDSLRSSIICCLLEKPKKKRCENPYIIALIRKNVLNFGGVLSKQ